MKSLLFALCLGLVGFYSCAKVKQIGSGNVVTETRTVSSDFDNVNITGPFRVVIEEGTNSGKVRLEADDNLLQDIIVETVNNALKVRFKTKSWNRSFEKLNVFVTAKDLNELTLSGSGEIVQSAVNNVNELKVTLSGSGDIITRANAEQVTITLSGSGDIEVTGTTNSTVATLSGSGDIEAIKLNAKNATATLSGSGDIEVHASEQARGYVSGSGDIVFHGNPSDFSKRVSGSGTVGVNE